MRVWVLGLVAAAAGVLMVAAPASACHKCRQNPCAYVAPAPAVQCVTEMVPYTVMKSRTRIDYQPVVDTVMTRVPETTWTERQRIVCKPVYETSVVQQTITVRKPVYDTQYVTQTVNVCRPITETQQVTDICMQPYTTYETVPVMKRVKTGHCGLCGHSQMVCGCKTVAKTCYTPVPVVRNVTTTRMIQDVETRQVPVTTCRIECETKVIDVPVRHCRMVQEVVTDRIPHVTYRCEPKQVTRMVPVKVCETVPVTCYRRETRMVSVQPVAYAAPQYAAVASDQGAAPSGQASGQQ